MNRIRGKMIRKGITRKLGMSHKSYMKYLFGDEAEEVERKFNEIILKAWEKKKLRDRKMIRSGQIR